jgi:hypothetical protein
MSAVLPSANYMPFGRTFSQAEIISPTIGSTGLVNAGLVLLTGTSSMQTAPPARVSPLPGTETSSRCQRMQPQRKRNIKLFRRPANSYVTASALQSSTG